VGQNLYNGYFTFSDAEAAKFLLLKPNYYAPGILDYAESTKQAIALGEILTLGSLTATNNFAGPVTVVTIYPCLRGWLVAGLPLIGAEHWGISLWAGPTSMTIQQESSIQSIQTSCSHALPVNLDNGYYWRQVNSFHHL
jgi:hypothetical protein